MEMVRLDEKDSSYLPSSMSSFSNHGNQHRVHFSPVVSQLRYSQNPRIQDFKTSHPSNHNNHYNNPSRNNHYSAPYYYSHLDSPDHYRDEDPSPRPPTNHNGHIEKVTVQQIQRPSQEKVQRVVMTLPSGNGPGRRFSIDLPQDTQPDPLHPRPGHILDGESNAYPDLLQMTPVTRRREKVDPGRRESGAGDKVNISLPRGNSISKDVREVNVNIEKGKVSEGEGISTIKLAGSGGKKSGFAHRLSLLKRFVTGGGRKGKEAGAGKKKKKKGRESSGENNPNKGRSSSLISNSSLETGIGGESETEGGEGINSPDGRDYPAACVLNGMPHLRPTLTDRSHSNFLHKSDSFVRAESTPDNIDISFDERDLFCPAENNGQPCWPDHQRIPKASPRLRKLIFKSKYSVSTSDLDDATDELSANVEKILEEIAGLEHIMESARSLSPKVEENGKDVSSEIADICAGLNELSTQPSAGLLSTKSTTLAAKPPLPPSSRNGLRHQFFRNSVLPIARVQGPLKADHKLSKELGIKLLEFREELHRSREEIAKSYPNFEEIENSVRSSMGSTIDRFGRNPQNSLSNSSWENSGTYPSEKYPGAAQQSRHAERELLKEWNSIISEAQEKLATPSPKGFNNDRRGYSKGILETDLDTGTSRELFLDNVTNTDENDLTGNTDKVVNSSRISDNYTPKLIQKSSCSMQNLTYEPSSNMSTLTPGDSSSKEDRSRSMEFLLDDSKNAHLLPPENTLKKTQDNRQASEHELRIQRSLQRLNVPDWYKNYATPGSGTPGSKPAGREFGSGTGLAGGWSGLSSSKTSSLTSLQSAGRYTGSRSQYPSSRPGPASTGGGRTSRESLMSPSSTASASPSPYYERSSFTYGMPYALSRFASRMTSGGGASPSLSLSPSPSPIDRGLTSSSSTPVNSGPMSRYGYNKTPYLGWRSQERLTSKTLYRSPSERAREDLLAQKQKEAAAVPKQSDRSDKNTLGSDISIVTSPRKETASDLSLNTSDESNSNKLNRVRSSIKEVSNAIVDYVNETKPLDDGINGRASPRRGLIWLESSFVGTKPIDSPGTPDTPSVMMSSSRHLGSQSSTYQHSKRSSLKFDEHNGGDKSKDTQTSRSRSSDTSPAFTSYISRNEKMGNRSNSSSVSSPTLEDILDSLLALRPPKGHKGHKIHKGHDGSLAKSEEPVGQQRYETPVSDWQDRMNQPLDDSAYFPADTDNFTLKSTGSNNQDNHEKVSYSSAFAEETSNYANREGAEEGVKVDRLTEGARHDEDSDVQGQIAQEESAFGTPTEIHTTISSIINNPLAGLNDSSNPPTPARNRRVSFDLDVSDKEISSSRSKRDESIGGTIQCRNSKCAKTATGLEARREFKTCHNCNAYYCSRTCRRISWEKHKKVCMQSRVGELCKNIISQIKLDSFVVSQLSTVAKRGFLAKGRGCVKLFFSSPDRAERFLTGGLPELPEPWYIPLSEILPEETGTLSYSELANACQNYNPETRFVLYASVCVVNEVPTSGAVKWEREMISRSAKIRLLLPRSIEESQPHHHAAIPSHLNPEESIAPYLPAPVDNVPSNPDIETLILRSVPTPASQKFDKRRRELSFSNIQKHLIERGVDLRKEYPDIYSRLCNYVEFDEPFLPVTIYPSNVLVCIIMPSTSDPSYEISTDPARKIETINISEQS